MSCRVVAVVMLLAGVRAVSAGVLINEVMYHSPTENLREGYVELYNPDTNAVNLQGWRFTKGINFRFPTNTPTVLAPGGHLVVASDAATFTNKYPGVTNFVAGWPGAMSSHLKLDDAAGQAINEVNFSNDGDWAARILTTNGFATFGHWGWMWLAPHDGLGNSLELITSVLPNSHGHAWESSSVIGGTPGRANSIARTNIAPIIDSITHSPVIPKPTDPVTISARLIDERTTGSSLTAYYRIASVPTPPAFTAVPMLDDGGHNDGLASDGVFAAILPAQANGTIIEFYVIARDLEGNTRTYPNVVPPANSPRTANLLYQVDDAVYSGSQPVYRMIMTEMERAELHALGRVCPDSESDALMNATWISVDGAVSSGSSTQLRYNIGVRNRGHGTRITSPANYHIEIPGDRSWQGLTGINLNSQYAHSQVLGSAIVRLLQLPMAESRAVQVRVNSTNLMSVVSGNSFGSYAANEQYNENFVQRAFPLDPYGNSYRGIRNQVNCGTVSNGVADLTWHGANPTSTAYTYAYFKQNNYLENDWADLIDLIAVLNSQNGHLATNYAADVLQRINVEQWMQYMAANILLDNGETCLATGDGDDYALFRGTNDSRFLALPYDLDTVLGRGNTATIRRNNIWAMTNLAAMNKFMKTPEFAPIYYKWLKTYSDTVFSPAEMNPLLDQLMTGYIPRANIDNFKAYNAAQASYIRSQIPLSISISNSLTRSNNFPYTTLPSVTLFGRANAINTRSVLVNGSPAVWTAWSASWTNGNVSLNPGLNRVLVQAFDASGAEFERSYADIWHDTGTQQNVSGTLAGNTTWTPNAGPYFIAGTLTVPSGLTLSIQPGTIVYLNTNANLVVDVGGTLLAEGATNALVRFTGKPGSRAPWGGIRINGSVGSPETRIAYALIESNSTVCIDVAGGTLFLDHTTFGTTTHPYLSLDGASFLVSHCHFPTTTAAFEPVHGGGGGIKTGGRGVFRDCFFGGSSGYSDIIDFTGGNRDLGQPILQVYNCVFAGSTDDILDLDGTDAWIEGNIFLHCHRNNSPDSSSAVSGGENGADHSEVTIIGNLFFDCDQAATAKQGNFFTLINNTIVHTTKTGGEDPESGVVNAMDVGTAFARGFYLDGNIIVDAEQLVRNYNAGQTTVTFNNNILPFAWTGPGASNLVGSPLLKYLPQLSETYFTNWQSAQVLRDWFSLQPGSPALATGPNGRDKGGVIPLGASLSGEPLGTNNLTTATLTIGSVRTGFQIPTAGWPNGSGYTHYKYRLDNGVQSPETPISIPIALSGLANGSHRVEVVGKRDSGWYQDDPAFGSDALVTTSRVWVVDTGYVPPSKPKLRLNEILAQNVTTLTNGGTTPDLVELFNYGSTPIDLVGMTLSDTLTVSNKFTFPPGTPVLSAGQHLTLIADAQIAAPGIHLGFTLKADGDDLYLYDKAASGGALLDSVVFGLQIPDYSLSRGGDGSWVLGRPTFGGSNVPVQLGDVRRVRINEWLADELFLDNNDFVELHNPDSMPVALSGCFLSNAEGAPALSPIPPLSFIPSTGYLRFTADSDPTQGANHLNFRLDPGVGVILLSDSQLVSIDRITYGPQTTDVSQGRSPNGSDILVSFLVLTPGAPNPDPNGIQTVTNITATVSQLLDMNHEWRYDNSGGTNLGTAWFQSSYPAEATWLIGTNLFGYDSTPNVYPHPFRTYVPPPNTNGGKISVYFRTQFQWTGALTNYALVSTNFVDDGAVYYLNGVKIGSIRMPATVTYNTPATSTIDVQGIAEGTPEILSFTNQLAAGDNVLAVEVHQVVGTSPSSDVAFGMQLNAVQFTTNLITSTTGIPVVLNEVFANNRSITNAQGATSDWIELLNLSTNTLNLADVSLSNDPNNPRKYVLAAGTTLAPNRHLVIFFDNDFPASTNNTGFSLDANSGTVLLFNSPANGGGLIDGLNYGLQAADFAVGRVPNGAGAWALTVPTAGYANNAAGLGSVSALRINEWMADPSGGSDWFEIYNSGELPVSINGLSFTDDLAKKSLSPVPTLSFVGTGASGFVKFIADNDPSAGATHVKFSLSKSGEQIGLFSPSGMLIDGISFGPQVNGVSEGRFPDGSTNILRFSSTSSPEESNYLPLPSVVVNEILAHTDPPLEDAVEFYNSSLSPVNIGGWFLSNSQDDLKKYRIADGTLIPARGFKVIYEYQFNPTNGSSIPFTFNSAHGDRVYLSQADGSGLLSGYRAPATFDASANGVSFGRYTNSIGRVDLVPMSARSFGVDSPLTLAQFRTGSGSPNPYPLVGPVVISEVMFYPPMLGPDDDTQNEFIELHNITASTVPLFDPMAPTNTWRVRGGIDFNFPQNISIPAGGHLLLVNFDPAKEAAALAGFRSKYNLSPTVPLFGPYGGNLANAGELLELNRPDPPQTAPQPDAGFVPRLLVEQIDYLNASPWPIGAGGTGSSLQRTVASNYGNDPFNWFVATPTPGLANGSNPNDINGDGLPDAWQLLYWPSVNDPQAAPGMDPDTDGFNNMQEYLAGTIPTSGSSFLKIDSVQVSGQNRSIHFTAVAGKSYTVLYKNNMGDAFWQPLANVAPQGATGPISVPDSTSAPSARFYRLITPQMP